MTTPRSNAGSQRRPAAKSFRRRIRQRFGPKRPNNSLRGAVWGRELLAVERLACRPRHGQCRGHEQHQARRASPWHSALRPTGKQGLRQGHAGEEAHVADDQRLKSDAQPFAAIRPGECQPHRRDDDHHEADVHPRPAHRRGAQGQCRIGGPQAAHDPFGHGHARHRSAGDTFDPCFIRRPLRHFIPGFAIPGLQKIAGSSHVLHMLPRVRRRANAHPQHVQRRVKCHEGIRRPAITDHGVRDRRSAQHVPSSW